MSEVRFNSQHFKSKEKTEEAYRHTEQPLTETAVYSSYKLPERFKGASQMEADRAVAATTPSSALKQSERHKPGRSNLFPSHGREAQATTGTTKAKLLNVRNAMGGCIQVKPRLSEYFEERRPLDKETILSELHQYQSEEPHIHQTEVLKGTKLFSSKRKSQQAVNSKPFQNIKASES